MVRVRGFVWTVPININIAAQGGCTVDQFKNIIQSRTGVQKGTYVFRVEHPAPPGKHRPDELITDDRMVVNLPQINNAIHLIPLWNGEGTTSSLTGWT